MQNFWYLFAAYMVFWTAMFAYVMSLSRKNRELQQELRELQARVEHMLVKKDTA
ncbi:MAG: CcmD family protein [Candidatus Tectomicrobia bacterium]